MIKKLMLVIPVIFSMLVTNLYGLETCDDLCLRLPVLSNAGHGMKRVKQIVAELSTKDSLSFSSPYAVFQALARVKKTLTSNMIAETYGAPIEGIERNLAQLVKIGLIIRNDNTEQLNATYQLNPKAEKWKAKVLQNLAQLPANPGDNDWQIVESNMRGTFDSGKQPIMQLSMDELRQLEQAKDIATLVDSVKDLFGVSPTTFQLNSLADFKAYKEIEGIIDISEDIGVIFDSYHILKANEISDVLERLRDNKKLKRRLEIITMASNDAEVATNALSILSELGAWDILFNVITSSNRLITICLGIQQLERFQRIGEIKNLRLDDCLKTKLIQFISKSKDIYGIREGIKALKIIEEKEAFKNSLEAIALCSEDNIIAIRESIAFLEDLKAEDCLNRIAEKIIEDFLKGTRKDNMARWLGLAQYGKNSSSSGFQNLLERWLRKRVRFQERHVPAKQPDFIWGREARSRGFKEEGHQVLVSKKLNNGETTDRQLSRMALAGVLLAGSGMDEREINIPVKVDAEYSYGYVTMNTSPQSRITDTDVVNVAESLKAASERLAMLYHAGCWLSLVPATHRLPVGDEADIHRFMWQNAVGPDRDVFKADFRLISLADDVIEKTGEIISPMDLVIYANIYSDGLLADLEDVRIGQGPWYPTSTARRAGQIAFEFLYIAMRSIALNNPIVKHDLSLGNKESLINETIEAFSYFWGCFLQRGVATEELEAVRLQLSDYINNDQNVWVWDTNKNPPDKILTRQYYQIWNIAWIFANKIYDRGEATQEAMMLDRIRTALGSVQEIFEKNGSKPVLVDEEFYNQIRGQSHFISPAQSMTQTNL